MGFLDNLISNIADTFDPDKIEAVVDTNLQRVEDFLDSGTSTAEAAIEKTTNAIDATTARIEDTIK